MMIYNNPFAANVDMLPETVRRLSEIDNIRYIKESTLDVTRVRDIIRLCGDRMTVFAGVLGYESFFLGAQGWVAVCSNVAPRLSADLFEAACDRNDPAEEPAGGGGLLHQSHRTRLRAQDALRFARSRSKPRALATCDSPIRPAKRSAFAGWATSKG